MIGKDFVSAAFVGLPIDSLFYVIEERSNLTLLKFGEHLKHSAAKNATSILVQNATQYIGFKIFKNPTFQQRLGVTMCGTFSSKVASKLVYRNADQSLTAILGTAALSSIIDGCQYILTAPGGDDWLESKGCVSAAEFVRKVKTHGRQERALTHPEPVHM